jgi:DMSO/TMAO reductase YedYZ molybdopterin-dependent catalytic subunit
LLFLSAAFATRAEVTPADDFFIRDHFAEPELSLAAWRLRVEGRVARPVELSFSDLLESATMRVESVLECAGNSPAGNGVSAGLWAGVPISKLLEEAGANPSGSVLLEGADEGQLVRASARAPYRRVVSQQKCRAPESMVAFKLNDRLLPRSHGFPARAILPGWYGMDSVKWLRRIVVLDGATTPSYEESGMGRLYCRLPSHGPPARISTILVKSMIADPSGDAKLAAGRYKVQGYAWTGEGSVARVEVSVDGGRNWGDALLDLSPQRFTWSRWTFSWEAQPGEHVLMSRAHDSLGNSQPLNRDPERLDSYELNWCAPVRCTVR